MRLFLLGIRAYARNFTYLAFATMLAGCAQVSLTPRAAEVPNPLAVSDALDAAQTPPVQVAVRDFNFSPSSVHENGSPLNRGIDLFRRSSAEQRHVEIGRDAAAALSAQAAKRLTKAGLPAVRVPSDSDMPLYDNTLLVTGRLNKVDEGNRFTRIALGLGVGESRLDTEVHVFRVMHGERAEVLAFTTHADSGMMPGLVPSMGVGQLLLGPITLITAIEDTASSGQKIYSSQLDYLAGETADQVAAYLSQYSADEGWIPRSKARSVKLAAR
jgi:Domain of unknown function (DUF4410)